MQDQEVEVSFCDLCGTSVPAADLEAGTAMRHQGRTVGACCLVPLRAGSERPAPPPGVVPAAGPAATPAGTASAASARSDSGRLLTVAVVLLVAFAAGVMFLDGRLSSLEDSWRSSQELAEERRKSDSDVLMDVALRVESVPSRSDLESISARADAIDTAVGALRTTADERVDSVESELQALREDLREARAQIIDYRPLFEDLRQRQVRLGEEVREASRKLAEVSTSPRQPVDVTPGGSDSGAGGVSSGGLPADLPADLAEQIEKLKAADEAVRFGAVDLLTESGNMKVLPYLLPMTKDADAFVRRLTVEGLARFKAPETIDALIAALADDDEYVCETAWRSLRDLTGQKFPFDAKASKEQRARAADRWREWWEKARATFG